MEKRTCKLCFRTFSNGRALGGHMRSHMLKLQAAPTDSFRPQQKTKLVEQLEDETDSASSYSSSSEEDDDKGLSYGLRENPRKSFRLVDPVFASFVADAGSFVQDWESEAESSRNPSRRRLGNRKKPIEAEAELVSSLSDTTSEEDVALCLMMLSRGITTRKAEDLEEEEGEKSSEEEIKTVVKSRKRTKYQCETCNKFFRSYQALGGHRANHKKIKVCNSTPSSSSQTTYNQEANAASATIVSGQRNHQCSVCLRVFSSGQALGGHKRSHLTGSAASTLQSTTTNTTNPSPARFQNYLIDLNLPAPVDDEDPIDPIDPTEVSAVSSGGFVR